jgi:hypothetical protein
LSSPEAPILSVFPKQDTHLSAGVPPHPIYCNQRVSAESRNNLIGATSYGQNLGFKELVRRCSESRQLARAGLVPAAASIMMAKFESAEQGQMSHWAVENLRHLPILLILIRLLVQE